MILLRILDHDLHRYKKGIEGIVFWIETPAKQSFLPAVVSLSTPKFSVTKKISNGMIRSGVFKYDQDRLDEVIPDLISTAYILSVDEKWDNIHSDPKIAFDWLQKKSGTKTQPHCVLVPLSWSQRKISTWAGKSNIIMSEYSKESGGSKSAVPIYRKICRVYQCGVNFPVFLSRPDFVGMYTQILGGMSSIMLHNVRNGMSFVKL